jgi:hypothetical protein
MALASGRGTSSGPQSKPLTSEPSIELHVKLDYIGNMIEFHNVLDISGPDRKTWERRAASSAPGTGSRGTYSIDGDLVICRAEDKPGGEVKECFASNFGFIGKEPWFDRFFPVGDGTLRYHTKSFRKSGDKWLPADELVVTMPATMPAMPSKAEVIAATSPATVTWEIHLTGYHLVWDSKGEPTKYPIDLDATYELDRWTHTFSRSSRGPSWLPDTLLPQFHDGKLAAIGMVPYISDVYGFGRHRQPWADK